jgi:biofilm protein TabA
MKKTVIILGLLVSFTIGAFSVEAQNNQLDKQDGKWFKKKEWLNGMQLQPHKTINKKEFARQYRQNKTHWDRAFAFLQNQDLNTIPKGKYSIDGENVFASVTIDSSKDFNKTNWESHRNYIDLQYVIYGKEKMGVCPISKATVIKEYNDKKDVANYIAEGKFYLATPGAFFIFFPSDVHRPNITPGGHKPVKKIVIKVKAAE